MEEAFGNLFSTMEQKTDTESGKVMLYHKADGTVTELTSKETALRNSIMDLLRNAGIEVITDNKEAQRVLDNENRNGLTRGLRLAIEDKEKGTGENPTAISDVTDPSIWDSSSSDAKVDNRIEVIDGSNVKLDELSSKIESNGELLPEDFLLSIENALGSDNENVDKSQYFKTDGDNSNHGYISCKESV